MSGRSGRGPRRAQAAALAAGETTAAFSHGSGSSREALKGRIFLAALILSVAIGLVMLVALIVKAFVDGLPRLNLDLVTSFPSSFPERAGIESAIWGTAWLMAGVSATVLPIGIGAAIYLEEYARKDRWYNRLIEANIQNLAAVPSIVYGILGLAFIVRGPLGLGDVVLAGSLTLALLVLPTVILASREAIRAVPASIREAALALGATRWQMIRRQVLPAATPGLATGMILALSRAIGETAPLLLVGGVTFITFNPGFDLSALDSPFTALPLTIFNYVARPQDEFRVVAAAAIIVLLVLLLTMNSFAIWLRNRYQRKW
ncbi:MAG TPA: phosphate ABC transporter permease PstA [Thermoleophilaceae bacterium]|nr:phosphate ABC transporter permease PstA [Thermoleophilaceae bacterium]